MVDSLLYFVKNTDELAGTLCHEVSHTIHHDAMELMEKREKIAEREVGAAILLGPSAAHVLAIALLGKLRSLSYSRDVESRADITGSDVCAATGYNPWGLVWLFQDFKDARDGRSATALIRSSQRPKPGGCARAALPQEPVGLQKVQPGSEVG